MEIWKDIKDYEGLYQVSNLGNIKSLQDNLWRKRERILKQTLWWNWYYKIVLYKNWKANTKLVHRLLAQAFIENPNNLPIIMHLDNNKTNLKLDNLKWWTQKENNYQIINEWRNNFLNWKHPDLWKFRWKSKWAKKVSQYNLQWEFIKIFDCIKDWAEEIWIKYNGICRACKTWKTAWWYKWSYLK